MPDPRHIAVAIAVVAPSAAARPDVIETLRPSSTTYLVPPLVLLLSWVLFGELPGWLAVVAGEICPAVAGLSRRRTQVGHR